MPINPAKRSMPEFGIGVARFEVLSGVGTATSSIISGVAAEISSIEHEDDDEDEEK
jgi:hypothetical protein